MTTKHAFVLVIGVVALGLIAYRVMHKEPGEPRKNGALSGKKISEKRPAKNELPGKRPGLDRTMGKRNVDGSGAGGQSLRDANSKSNAVKRVLSEEEKKVREIRLLLDEGKEREAMEIARGLKNSKDPEIRLQVLPELGWVGWKALSELSSMLADSDKAVAEEAFKQWKMAVGELTDLDSRFDVLVEGLKTVKESTDIDSILIEFNTYPDDQVVGMIQTLLQDPKLNPVLRESLLEQYEFTTGSPWVNQQAAEAFIQRYRAAQAGAQNENPQPAPQKGGQ